MKNSIITLTFCVCLIFSFSSYGQTRKVKVEVLDDLSQPIKGAEVSASFDGSGMVKGVTKITGADGILKFGGSTPYSIPVIVRKDGYYISRVIFSKVLTKVVSRKTILRKIKDPKRMFAKTAEYVFPVLGEKIGFDFSVGDWVAPYGTGTKVDVYFLARTVFSDLENNSFTLELSFPNEMDGIIHLNDSDLNMDSEFSFPYKAPDAGYQNKGVISSFTKDGSWEESSFISILRTRTEYSNGDLHKANYTKLVPAIVLFDMLRKPKMDLTYYFNPEVNNRSMEFDVKKNLNTSDPLYGRTLVP